MAGYTSGRFERSIGAYFEGGRVHFVYSLQDKDAAKIDPKLTICVKSSPEFLGGIGKLSSLTAP